MQFSLCASSDLTAVHVESTILFTVFGFCRHRRCRRNKFYETINTQLFFLYIEIKKNKQTHTQNIHNKVWIDVEKIRKKCSQFFGKKRKCFFY